MSYPERHSMTESKPHYIRWKALVTYFILSYGITWICSLIATNGLLPFQLPTIINDVSSPLVHYGPALAALMVVGIAGGRTGIRELLKRFRLWRVGIQWYLFVLLYPPLIKLIAVGLNILLGGSAPTFFSTRLIHQGNPFVLFIPVFIVVFFQAGIAEEIGWRGFALPQLQSQYSALTSSLILGVLWALWHFYPQNWSILLPTAWWYILGILSLTIIFTWVFNHTYGSLLLAILFHTANNTSDWIIPIEPAVTGTGAVRVYILYRVCTLLFAVALVLICGPKYLSHRGSVAKDGSVYHEGVESR